MNDTDFEQFIKLLDAALVSDNKRIKTALRKFMFIIALNLSDDDCDPGPFTEMMETINELQRRLAVLETKDNNWTTTETITWPYGVGVGTGTGTPPPYIAPSTTSGQITGTGASTTQWTNISTAPTSNTTTTATTANITGSSGTVYTINLGNEDTGTKIKNAIKDSLAKLAI